MDNFTGTNLPDYKWGYGKANAYNLVRGCLIGVDENEYTHIELSNYPNPFTDLTTINYDLSNVPSAAVTEIAITDVLGKEVRRIAVSHDSNSITLRKDELKSGLYFCSVLINGKPVKTNKLAVM